MPPRWRRFSLLQLLLAVTLIGLGLGLHREIRVSQQPPKPWIAVDDDSDFLGLGSPYFCPDGVTLAIDGVSRDQGNYVKLFDLPSRRFLASIPGRFLAISPDGRLLATKGQTDTGGAEVVRLWTTQGQLLHNLRALPLQMNQPHNHTAVFSPDSRMLALVDPVTGRNDAVTFWDIRTGRPFAFWQHDQSPIQVLQFSPDGRFLASVNAFQNPDGPNLKLWDVKAQAPAGWLSADTRGYVDFSPDGRWMIARWKDFTLWDLATGKAVRSFSSRSYHPVLGLPRGGRVLLGDLGEGMASYGVLSVWDLVSGEPIALRNPGSQFYRVAFSPDGTRMAGVSIDGTVEMWDLRNGAGRAFRAKTDTVGSPSFSPDSRLLAIQGMDLHGVEIWDIASQTRIASHPEMEFHGFSANGRYYRLDIGGGMTFGGDEIWNAATLRPDYLRAYGIGLAMAVTLFFSLWRWRRAHRATVRSRPL